MTLFLCVHKESLFILASSLSASVLVFLGLLLVFFYGFLGGWGVGWGGGNDNTLLFKNNDFILFYVMR